MPYINGKIRLNDGRLYPAHLEAKCAKKGVCACGFCKAARQCEFGDCHNLLPEGDGAGTLCWGCSKSPWRAALPGHRASVSR